MSVNEGDQTCVVDAGVTREDLNSYIRETGLHFPVDPGANASLGGMAATSRGLNKSQNFENFILSNKKRIRDNGGSIWDHERKYSELGSGPGKW